ncbi:MAG TPA: PAS domain S-box protein [Bacteroidales bacterium]|nr:PAS domain S-box protein [Bacteroidales bacterium]
MEKLSAQNSGFVSHSSIQELKSFLNRISYGFCIVEIIFNGNGKAIDWIYNEVNPALEKQTGIKDVIAKRLSEVIPGEEQSWKDRLAAVTLTGNPAEFIEYSKPLQKWFEVSAVPYGNPEKHYVALLLSDITEKKKAEAVLNENRERYQALIETNVDFIWEVDREGRYTYCSPQMLSLWGLNPGEMIGRTPFDLQPEVERAKSLGMFRKILKKAAPFNNLEFTSSDAAGNTTQLEASGVPFFNLFGELMGFRGITRDVTSRKKEQDLLRENEKTFRTIIETANEGIIRTDENLTIRYVNDKMVELTGYKAGELIGQHISSYFSKEENSRLMKIIPQVKKGIRRNFEICFIRKDHTEVIASVNATAFRDDAGNYTGFIGMITDITERVMMERDLKRTRRKLQTALRNANIGTWEWNFRTNEVNFDRRTEEIFGLKPGSFKGTGVGFSGFVHEEDISYVETAMKKAIAERTAYEAIFRTKPIQSKCNYVLSKATISRDRKGNPLIISGVCFDVTEMKEGTEQTLIRLNEDLLSSNRDLQQFAYVASHDLQEPLRMVSSFTQLLQMRYADKLDRDANDYINFAVNGSRRMYELLNGLLAYSRIQTRGHEFEDVDIKTVVEKVKANIKLLIEESDASIICNELPVVKADENQMIQLMQNLIENAIKFRTEKPVITITSAQKGDFQIISVKDNGIGIEQVYFERIFRIFQRLHRSEVPGTGIGLAICQRIVERHGGRIWVNSKQGEGSVFSFSLPHLQNFS